MAEARFHQLLYYASHENNDFLEEAKREVPDAWLTLELDMETVAKKQKVSLYLDEAVVKMFRAMGPGYQGRINRILETWMQMKIAEKTGMYRDLMAQLEADGIARLENGEPEDVVSGGKSLAENWGYNEGFRDGLEIMGARPKVKAPGGNSPDASKPNSE
ncbi:MAG: BrnA antitoxin family protein [Boseongicola sp.]|nr:BrnA antitoxin family protein [Boseongicola sp.]